MDWHYAAGGRQLGPVSEEQLLQLAREGTVKSETLVWHAGMTDWKPYWESVPGVPPPVPASGGAARFCQACGRSFPVSDLAMFGDAAICAECKPAWVQRLRQGMPVAGPGALRYAGFWIRFGAILIDGIIVSIVQGAVFFGFFGGDLVRAIQESVRTAQAGGDPDPTAALVPMFAAMGSFQLLSFLFQMTYMVFFVAKYGATPGKMAAGLKVVTPTGGEVSTGQAFGRYFAALLSGLILGIGYLMAAWDEQKRSLHDRLAGTRVIRVR